MTSEHVVRPGTLPTPFSAAQIRAATTDGMTLLVRTAPAVGEPTWRRTTFVRCDPDGALREFVATDAAGVAIATPEAAYSTWLELQGHAVFDEASASRRPETLDGPLGPLECLRYDVDEDGEHSVFWFALALPGMPIAYEVHGGGADGGLLVRVDVVAHSARPPAH